MKFRDKIILGLLLVLFASGIAMAGRYILRSGDVIFFDAITRHGVSSMAGDGLSGGDSTLEVDFGTTANTACEGNDARIPSTDEKAAMTGANSPSASNVFATMTDVSAGETGVELITTTSPIDDDGSAEQPNIIIASGYAVPTDAEKGHYDLVVLDSPIWQATSDKVDADSLVWADKYTQAEADALLLDKADTPHDHNNLYYTESEADALLLDKADTPHAHDDRYYTESESDALLLDKADTPHAHDDRYYTETELDAGQLDNRYYTETESNSLLADKVALADSALHQHVEADITDLDKYSQSEVDTLLLDKVSLADSDLHQHTESDITDLDKYTTSEADALLDLKVNLTDTGIWEAAAAEVNADSAIWEDKYTQAEADALLNDKADQADTPNWNTAYGWGDHADQNYFDIDIDTLDDIPDGSTYKLSHNDFSDAYKAELDAATADSYLDVGQKAAIDLNTDKVTNATHTGDVSGATELTIGADKVHDTMLDWGTGADQVSAADVPIADDSGIITATDVEIALQENRTAINLNTDKVTNTDNQTIDVFSISGNDVQLSLERDGEATKTVDISTTTAVTANSAKNTNVPTELEVGTVGVNTVAITSDGGADDVTLPAATSTTAGMLTKAKWEEIVANNAKNTNVSTALSEGTRDDTTYAINSDGSSPDLILPQATTDYAGLLSGTKWNEIVANTLVKHTQNTDTDLDATFEATFVKKTDTVNVLSDITSAGADIEDAVTKKHTHTNQTLLDAIAADSCLDVGQKAELHTHTNKALLDAITADSTLDSGQKADLHTHTNKTLLDAIVADSTLDVGQKAALHTQGTDTTLGTMTANIDLNGYKVTSSDEPTVDSDLATKYYVDNSGGGAGDMLKSTYDPDDDGKIAEAQLKLYVGTIELWKAIQILAFRQNNFEYMIDGYNNPFDVENEGIDTALSDTYLYDATGDYYYQDTTAGATTTLDMMEYSTSELAQAAYVSSDKADDYTKLLLHLNGADEATSTIDDSDSGHSITFNGTAQLDTAQKVFGTASLLLDGNSDYLSMVDHADFDLGTDDFTIDFWIRRDGDQTTFAGTVCACSGDTGWIIRLTSNGKSELVSNASGIWALDMTSDTALSDTTWTHLALVRNGNTIKMYLGGVEVATCDCTGYTYDCGGAGITIGLYPAPGGNWYFKGHIDEIRISKGIARWTSNFTPPVTEYPHLECYSESTIKTQGDYSLKGVAVITDSLNDTLTRTVDPTVDLSGKDDWVFYIYSADRTGSNIKAGIHDSGGTTTESTPDVTDTGVWQKVTVDVSGVTDANKDVIDSIIITPVNADASNTFYLDNVFGQAVATGGGNMELYTSYYQIGLDSANVKAMILSNKEPTSVSLTRTGTGTSLTEGVLSDSDVYNSTYYSFNYSADVSGESSDTCIRAFIESSDTTIHFYGISLLGLE